MSPLLLLAALAASGSGSATLEPGVQVTLAPGETATSPDGALAVTFLEVVEDSRCPEGVQCVWAGNARVRLRLREGAAERETELNSTLAPREAPLGSLLLRFVDLLPHPRPGMEPDPDSWRLVLEVAPRG